MVTFDDICKCSCMDIIYQDYTDYILSKEEIGPIYKKLLSKQQITVEECEKLIKTIQFDFSASYPETHTTPDCYRNCSKIFGNSQIFHNCQNKQEEIENQEYDEYGPIGEPDIHVITCINGFTNTDNHTHTYVGPPVVDMIIMTFLLNVLENNHIINLIYNATTPDYIILLEECFDDITEFCGVFDILLNKKNLYSDFYSAFYFSSPKKYKITYHRFKGFEYYYKKIFGYSLLLENIGIPAQHQQNRNSYNFETMIYGHPLASHGLCYESMNAIEAL